MLPRILFLITISTLLFSCTSACPHCKKLEIAGAESLSAKHLELTQGEMAEAEDKTEAKVEAETKTEDKTEAKVEAETETEDKTEAKVEAEEETETAAEAEEKDLEEESACKGTESECWRYKWLSFFFDGVPVPGEEAAEDISPEDRQEERNQKRSAIHQQYVYHSPYQDKSCNDCHNENRKGTYVTSLEELCYECHDNFSEEFAYIHSPVDSGECTECHSPHFSKNQYMLLRAGNELCSECHDVEDLSEIKGHALTAKPQSCTGCHNPHGGADERLLKKE